MKAIFGKGKAEFMGAGPVFRILISQCRAETEPLLSVTEPLLSVTERKLNPYSAGTHQGGLLCNLLIVKRSFLQVKIDQSEKIL